MNSRWVHFLSLLFQQKQHFHRWLFRFDLLLRNVCTSAGVSGQAKEGSSYFLYEVERRRMHHVVFDFQGEIRRHGLISSTWPVALPCFLWGNRYFEYASMCVYNNSQLHHEWQFHHRHFLPTIGDDRANECISYCVDKKRIDYMKNLLTCIQLLLIVVLLALVKFHTYLLVQVRAFYGSLPEPSSIVLSEERTLSAHKHDSVGFRASHDQRVRAAAHRSRE